MIGRSDPSYDDARKLYNAMIDKRPLLIARCVDAADVIAAVNFGRENKLPIIVFNIRASGAFAQVMRGEGKFTRIIEVGDD